MPSTIISMTHIREQFQLDNWSGPSHAFGTYLMSQWVSKFTTVGMSCVLMVDGEVADGDVVSNLTTSDVDRFGHAMWLEIDPI